MAMFSSGDAIQNPYLAAAAKSEGINYALVNGHVVIDRGNHTGNSATRARIPRSWFNYPAVKSYLRASRPLSRAFLKEQDEFCRASRTPGAAPHLCLRHSKLAGLREDKDARTVAKG